MWLMMQLIFNLTSFCCYNTQITTSAVSIVKNTPKTENEETKNTAWKQINDSLKPFTRMLLCVCQLKKMHTQLQETNLEYFNLEREKLNCFHGLVCNLILHNQNETVQTVLVSNLASNIADSINLYCTSPTENYEDLQNQLSVLK